MNETHYLTSALTELLQLRWHVLLCVQQVVQRAHGRYKSSANPFIIRVPYLVQHCIEGLKPEAVAAAREAGRLQSAKKESEAALSERREDLTQCRARLRVSDLPAASSSSRCASRMTREM